MTTTTTTTTTTTNGDPAMANATRNDMRTKTIGIRAERFATAEAALRRAYETDRGQVVHTHADGQYLLAEVGEIERLERAGVSFAILFGYEYPPDSGQYRIVTVPVN